MLDYLVFFNLLILVCSGGIVKQADVNVSLGEDATFSCALPGARGVKQVIWQQHRDVLRNMVTFSDRFKPQVDAAFVGKVNVTVASVHTTTIVIKNVSFADDACYVCTFSVYPSGTERETACLSVQGLTEIKSQPPVNTTEKDTVVSCLATGKPTPVISWWSGEQELKNDLSNVITVQNGDSTVTTTSNLTISKSHFSGTYIKCVAKSGSIERSVDIFMDEQPDIEASRRYTLTAVIMISFFFVVSCVLLLYRMRKNYQNQLPDIA